MPADFFLSNFVLFAVVTAACTLGQSYLKSSGSSASKDASSSSASNSATAAGATPPSLAQSGSARSLWRAYILVYALVMGADWLQGPYMYPLYSGLYEFADRTVAALFVFGFTAGGVSAPYVGKWADKYGRKRMCLVFCGTYGLSSLIVLYRSLPLLLLGRVFGGISTSILFSCFEAWLISSAHDLGVSDSELSSILSRCTFINGIVAAISGVFSNVIVSYFGSVKAPFLASAILLALAALAIRSTWTENYGEEAGKGVGAGKNDVEAVKPLMGDGAAQAGPASEKSQGNKSALKTIFADPALITLGITQTFYETAMYLFVFLWVPALEIVTAKGTVLPFGIIFSAFMVCMSFGSLIYGIVSSSGSSSDSEGGPAESTVKRHASLASVTCAAAALALVTSALSTSLAIRFWAFCAFEATVGMYFPIMGTLRGNLIPDEARASFSALFRVPLNVLVTISLITGAEEHKDMVILASVAMLGFGSIAMFLGIRTRV